VSQTRHLNETQRGIVANKIANMPVGRNWDNSANLQNKISQPEAAQMLNVSPRTIASVKAIERDAPDLLPKMESGEMSAPVLLIKSSLTKMATDMI
jgi:DNA-binding XRE family transcriptional regulator